MSNLETLARLAHQANSYREYKPGKAEYDLEMYVNCAELAAEKAISKLKNANAPQERIDDVGRYLARYKSKIEEWLADVYRNEASCPSIMVAGPSNFPTNKKNKQNARRKSLMENSPEYLIRKIKGIGNNARTIYSDEKNAADRIREKIAALEASDKTAKRINAYYKKHGTLEGCPNIDEKTIERHTINGRFWGVGYNNAEIRRLNERLLQLDPESVKAGKSVTVTSGDNTAATYDEIISLFDEVEPHKSHFDGSDSFYISIPLVFSDGSRNYNECLHFETEESGETVHQYGNRENGYKSYFVPLTDERKFDLIISKISGSGNKRVIYQILKDLKPRECTPEQHKNTPESINDEPVQIIHNNDLMRLQLIFDGIPSPETRGKLKSNGFKWAPSQKAWQRLLNANAEYALKRLLA